MKYKEWLSTWLENYVRVTVKSRTYERYSEVVKCHLNPVLGEVKLCKLDSIMLQKYVTDLLKHDNLRTGQPLTANSVNAIITVMQSSLRVAYKLNLIKNNIGDNIMRPKSREKQVQCFSVEEQKRIEKAVFASNKPYMIGVITLNRYAHSMLNHKKDMMNLIGKQLKKNDINYRDLCRSDGANATSQAERCDVK